MCALGAWGRAASECDAPWWTTLRTAMIDGDARAVGELVGHARVSLRVDGVPPGSYTADQAVRLLGDLFRGTTDRSLEYGACGSTGEGDWAEAVFRYRWAGSRRQVVERLLLEFCDGDDDMMLCGIRSASPH